MNATLSITLTTYPINYIIVLTIWNVWFRQFLFKKIDRVMFEPKELYLFMWFSFNPFPANVPILYPLKTAVHQRFFGIFRGNKMATLARNELILGIFLAVNKLMIWQANINNSTLVDSFRVAYWNMIYNCRTIITTGTFINCFNSKNVRS